jgi:class 3 adenylate cyclase
MPLYMDLHKLTAQISADNVAKGHLREMDVQKSHDVKFLTYWFNEAAGKVFCLLDAPNVNAVVSVHRDAHGMVPDEIIEVEAGSVEGFMGKIEETTAAKDPTKPVTDNAFRIILFTDLEGSTAITQQLGDERAMELLRAHDAIVRGALASCGGSEVKHTGDGIMASFVSVSAALGGATEMQRAFAKRNAENPGTPLGVRIGLSAGEPVAEHSDLFGAAVQLAARICEHAEPGTILVSNVIRELAIGKEFEFTDRGRADLKGFPGPVGIHEVTWRV